MGSLTNRAFWSEIGSAAVIDGYKIGSTEKSERCVDKAKLNDETSLINIEI